MSKKGSAAAKLRWQKAREDGSAYKTAAQYEAESVWNGECLEHKKNNGRLPRKIFQMRHGPLPDDIFVLHRCDNRFCIRDQHLFIGTQQDNMRDAVAKGRHRCLKPQSAEEKAKRSASLVRHYATISSEERSLRAKKGWKGATPEEVLRRGQAIKAALAAKKAKNV